MLDPIFNSPVLYEWLKSPLFQFLFIVIAVSMAVVKVTLQGAACRKHIRNSQDSLLFNAMFFASVAVFLALVLGMQKPNGEILLWACFMGVGTVLFQVAYSVALTEGPVSITVLINNFNIFVPTVLSVFIFHENVYYSQLLGIVFLIISMPLSMKESTEGEKKGNKKWLTFTLLTFFAGCFVGTLQKLFKLSKSYAAAPDTSSNTFLLFIYIFSAIFALLVYLFRKNTGSHEKHTFKFGKSVVLFAVAMGLDLAVYQKVYMVCNMNINGSFFFPTFAGMQSLVMTIIGVAFFHDKLNKRQLLGVLCGILAVIFLNVQTGAYFTIG